MPPLASPAPARHLLVALLAALALLLASAGTAFAGVLEDPHTFRGGAENNHVTIEAIAPPSYPGGASDWVWHDTGAGILIGAGAAETCDWPDLGDHSTVRC